MAVYLSSRLHKILEPVMAAEADTKKVAPPPEKDELAAFDALEKEEKEFNKVCNL